MTRLRLMLTTATLVVVSCANLACSQLLANAITDTLDRGRAQHQDLHASVTNPASCTESTARTIRETPMEDWVKADSLRSMGCDASDLEAQVAKDREAALALAKEREAQAQAEQATREAEKKKAHDEDIARMAAEIAEKNAQRDAFEQEMANQCGGYPLAIKIGMSEKLLTLGCAGPARLVGESPTGRVYRMRGALVTVQRGRVVLWAKE